MLDDLFRRLVAGNLHTFLFEICSLLVLPVIVMKFQDLLELYGVPMCHVQHHHQTLYSLPIIYRVELDACTDTHTHTTHENRDYYFILARILIFARWQIASGPCFQ